MSNKKDKNFYLKYLKTNRKIIKFIMITFIFSLSIIYSSKNLNNYFDQKLQILTEPEPKTFNKPFKSTQAENVCITEIYADGSVAEWIEIYNPTNNTINFTEGSGWKIYDGDLTTTEINLATTVGSLAPGAVITIGDVGMYIDNITLNDGDDDLIIVNGNGEWVDVVIYGSGSGVNLPLGQWYWISNVTVTPAPDDPNESIYRINKTIGGQLEDNNMNTDWNFTNSPTPGILPQYNPREPKIGDLLISEIKYSGTDCEWIELFNNITEELHIGGCTLYMLNNNQSIMFPLNTIIKPNSTYLIGELSGIVDYETNITLNDDGDVIILKNASEINIDTVVFGYGSSEYQYGAENGWTSSNNATGSVNVNESIFRYNLTRRILADTNSSDDWYVTNEPTPGSFYKIKVGDILFSEIGMSELSNTEEFIELYNNLTWPVTLDGIIVFDYEENTIEIEFLGNITIPPRWVIVAGDNMSYDYYDNISLTNGYEDLVLYLDSSKTYELDVVIYGDDPSNTYPRGAGSGWNDNNNVSVGSGLPRGTSIHRINSSNYELIDTNTSSDWKIGPISRGIPGIYVSPQPPGEAGSVLITEVMINPSGSDNGYEYVEIYNPLDIPIDISNWTIRHQGYINSSDATIPLGTIIPPKTHFTIIENETNCVSRYNFSGLNYTEDLVITNNPDDVILIDSYMNIIDRVAYRTSTTNFTNNLDPYSWKDNGVYMGSEGKVICRIYDPNNNDSYIDTNSSADWRYNIYPNPGKHTNLVIFLSSSFSSEALITPFNSPDNSFNVLTNLINLANSTIDICVYQFTNYYILEHLVNAMDRGVKVRLLLEDIYPLYDSPYLKDNTHGKEKKKKLKKLLELKEKKNYTKFKPKLEKYEK